MSISTSARSRDSSDSVSERYGTMGPIALPRPRISTMLAE